jgi:hypothetical protein
MEQIHLGLFLPRLEDLLHFPVRTQQNLPLRIRVNDGLMLRVHFRGYLLANAFATPGCANPARKNGGRQLGR